MTARRDDNAVRGVVFALIPAAIAWLLIGSLLAVLALLLPASVLIALAAVLIIGPLLVYAFKRDPK